MQASEITIQRILVKLGYEVHNKGWPDFLCVKNNELVGIEVKSGYDETSPSQKKMHELLKRAGIPCYVVNVDDLENCLEVLFDLKGKPLDSIVKTNTIKESFTSNGENLNTKEAALYLRVSTQWLEKLRCWGNGPKYYKIGTRVIYSKENLDEWVSNKKRLHTSDKNNKANGDHHANAN